MDIKKMEISGYEHNFDYLADEMKLLDMSIYMKLKQMHFMDGEISDELKGFVMSLDEAMCLLHERTNAAWNDEELAEISSQYAMLAEYIQEMRRSSELKNIFLPMNYLQKVFHLDSFEERCILLCLAYELDRKYEKLFAFLQDDMNKQYVTVDLLLRLFCETKTERWEAKKYFLPQGKLMKYFFINDEEDDFSSGLSRKLKLDERIVHFLLEIDLSNSSLLEIGEIFYPNDLLSPLLIHESFQNELRQYVSSASNHKKLVFLLCGKQGIGKKLQVKWLCKYFYHSLVLINVKQLASHFSTFQKQLKKIIREAVLQQSVLCFAQVDSLFNDENAKERIRFFLNEIEEFSGSVFLLADERISYDIQSSLKEKLLLKYDLPFPEGEESAILWEKLAKNYRMSGEVSFQRLGTMFSYTPGQMLHTLKLADEKRKWLKEEHITYDHLLSASYDQVNHHFSMKAVRIEPKYKWDDLVLPKEQKEMLKDACNQVKYRDVVYGKWGFDKKLSYGKGISMLFAGPPGTGNTMSAEVVANELKLQILKVDLSQVVSKYIGETEKNLKEIFEHGEQTNSILFFDETDALFGKRSQVRDARDKYANIEVAYLLQKMEEHRGIAILATNFLENIDEAFLRRINYIVHFTLPNVEQREEIWRKMFPPQAPVSDDIDFKFLAEKIPISGGNIKNIVLSAAFLAADLNEKISMKHIIKAAKQEMRKAGKILLPEDLAVPK